MFKGRLPAEAQNIYLVFRRVKINTIMHTMLNTEQDTPSKANISIGKVLTLLSLKIKLNVGRSTIGEALYSTDNQESVVLPVQV